MTSFGLPMIIKKVLLATKQTALEYYRQSYDSPQDVIPRKLLSLKKKEHEEHYLSLNLIREVLKKYDISYKTVYMPYAAHEEFLDNDLIISVGGDGTVLNTARFIRDKTPLLAVKSEKDSAGVLCTLSARDFEKALKSIFLDDFKMQSWTRAEGKFGNKIDIALNEIAIGTKHFNGLAHYEIRLGGKSERQRSSKIIVATGTGSTGWYANIPYSEKRFSPEAKELKYLVSEHIKKHKYSMVQGSIGPGQTMEITSLMDVDGTINFDGDKNRRMYPFPIGKKLRIKISDSPLKVIIPKI